MNKYLIFILFWLSFFAQGQGMIASLDSVWVNVFSKPLRLCSSTLNPFEGCITFKETNLSSKGVLFGRYQTSYKASYE